MPGLGVPPGSSTTGEKEEEEEFSFLDFMFAGTVRLYHHDNLCLLLCIL